MPYLFSFSRYQAKCVIKLLFKQLMTSSTLRFFLDQPPKQWPTGRKRREDGNTKYLDKEKSFLDEIKSIFHSFLLGYRLVKNKNLIKNSGHKLLGTVDDT